MTPLSAPACISAILLSITILATLYLDAMPVRGWLLSTTIGIVPIGVLLRRWNDGLAPAMAEVLYSTEARR
jgi:hypothetical protein